MMFSRHSLAVGVGGFFTGLATYYQLLKKRPFIISAGPVDLDIEETISRKVESHNLLQTLIKHGIPGFDCLRFRGSFLLSYDRRNRVPHWVMEHLTNDMIDTEKIALKKHHYPKDETIHDYFKSTNEDYLKSGYDKGHLAKADYYKHSHEERNNTFLLSNIVPQNSSFNRGIWKILENHVAELVKKYKSVYVCSGPLYLPRELTPGQENILQEENSKNEIIKREENAMPEKTKYIIYKVIGNQHVAVPTHFFKIILCEVKENVYDIETYVIPNEKDKNVENYKSVERLRKFLVEKDAVERAAGFLVFDQLSPSAIRRINGQKSDSFESSNEKNHKSKI